MSIIFDAHKKFQESEEEVTSLLVLAKENQKEESTYSACNKSALLLLLAKFESFLESISSEYVEFINNSNLKSTKIPIRLKVEHSLCKLENCGLKSISKKREIFEEIGLLWGVSRKFCNLDLKLKFSYGNHGSNEIEKLFCKIGFEDIFSKVKVYKKVLNISPTKRSKNEEIEFRGKVDSATGMRNNIIHQDATPNLTHLDVCGYHDTFSAFALGLSKLLIKSLKKIRKKS